MKLYFISALLFICTLGFAQENTNTPTRWINLETDNDYMVFGEQTDRFYSFGLNADFSFLTSSEKEKIHTIGMAIEGYTPTHKDPDLVPDSLRRPYTGWSYLYYEQLFHSDKFYFKLGVQFGTLGKSSRAGQLQNRFHEIANYVEVDWTNQVKDNIGLNLLADINYQLFNRNNNLIVLGVDNSLGNVFTFSMPYLSYQLSNEGKESYLPYRFTRVIASKISYNFTTKIGVRAAFHNSTLEGEFFSDPDFFVDDDNINRFVAYASAELRLSYQNWSASFSNVYMSRQIKDNESHIYGIAGLGYSF